MSASSVQGRTPWNGRHVLAMLVAGFAIVFAVNGMMAYLAVSTFSGLDGEDSYRRGIDYNATIAEAQRQTSLGWSAQLDALPERKGMELVLTDRTGAPVAGLTVSGVLGRASTNRFDRAVTLLATAPGHYQAAFPAALDPGAWVATLTAVSAAAGADAVRFQLRQRLWLK